MKVQISSIEIKNIGCIESLDIKPQVLTTITGRNASGKTTILDALRSIPEAGHDPSLLRKGADEGSIKITLSDGVTIKQTITPEKTTRVVRHPQYGKISKAKEWIQSVINSVSFDPVRFLTAKPAERLAIFLESLPIKLDPQQVSFLPAEIVQSADFGRHPLEVIGNKNSGLFGAVYKERTEINRLAKDKRSTAAEMERQLPEESPEGDWNTVLQQANEDYRQLQQATRQRLNAIEKACIQERDASADKSNKRIEQVRTELERKIEQLRAEAQVEIDRAHEEFQETYKAAEAFAKERIKEEEEQYRPKEAALKEKIGHARAMAEQQAKAQATRDLIARINTEATEYEEKSENLTACLKRLEAVKASLLEKLPIEGMEIQDGQLLVNGISFDRLNDAAKHRIAVEIMRLNQGQLGLMVLDRAEIFDSKGWESFKKACKSAGVPVIAARVSDCELTVTTEGKEVA